MNYSSTNLYTPKEDYMYRSRETLYALQTPFLTHRAVSDAPTFSYPTGKFQYLELSTSNSLGSYKQMSPIKSSAPAPDLFDSFKRLLDIAISNKWT
ncbi:unnamed protein product [Sphagnum balticum]